MFPGSFFICVFILCICDKIYNTKKAGVARYIKRAMPAIIPLALDPAAQNMRQKAEVVLKAMRVDAQSVR